MTHHLTDVVLMRLFLLTLLLAGCTTGPTIAPMATAPDVFVLTRESPGGFPMKDKLQAEALEEARKYCEARQAVRQVVDSQTSTGWNMTGNTPRFQVRFRCVPQAEPTPK
ncbi:hypothetical protein [Rhizobacter sp. Root1221]|uniref:hypothetical protein n=1 Tax=Rhizobacter sp. Root1221 TaxID=1736433 RepID=UPI0006F8CEB6|nr:hypothetical protein [Rhizobacter sp. Root1221]KQV97203.1 hypothetical protein ASC87_23680 [Rhizobacter sp. Root1221]